MSCAITVLCTIVLYSWDRRLPSFDSVKRQLQESGNRHVDLTETVTSDWDRVCFLGPYSLDWHVDKVLGFNWSTHTNTTMPSDGEVLLLFVRGNRVVEHFNLSRYEGGFDNFHSQCVPRQVTIFRYLDHPEKGGMYPESHNMQLNPDSLRLPVN